MYSQTTARFLVLLLVVIVCCNQVVCDVTPGQYGSKCSSPLECNYVHSACWEMDGCDTGMCLCEFDYFFLNDTHCMQVTKINEPCSQSEECPSEAPCVNTVCTCKYFDAATSDDMYSCHRRRNESCNSDECGSAMECINDEFCGCGVGKTYEGVLTTVGMKDQCVSDTATDRLSKNAQCTDSDLCDKNMTCWKCVGTDTRQCLRIVGPMSLTSPTTATTPNTTATAANTTTAVNTTTIADNTASDPIVPAKMQHCTSKDHCNYEGGACWKMGYCNTGVCLCEDGLSLVDNQKCVKRKVDEPCSTDNPCRHPLKCVMGKCGCGAKSTYVSVSVFGREMARCIPQNKTALNEYDACNTIADYCGSDMICISCPNSTEIAKCVQTYIVQTPSGEEIVMDTGRGMDVAALKSGAEQVSMVVWAVGCLSLSATLVANMH